VEAKDAEILGLRLELDALREVARRLELRLAELERRLSMDSSDSGTPSSKEGIGAKAARKAREKKERQESERERDKNRKPGGQPGHREKARNATLTRTSGRPLSRRRSAGPAAPPWTARTQRSRGGRRSSTSRSSARSPRSFCPGWPFEPGTLQLTAGRSAVELSRKGRAKAR